MTPRRTVAFDFDGTLTTCDTLPRVLRHTFGIWRYTLGLLACLHWIAAWKLRLCPGGKAKERLLAHFVEGMPHDDFAARCRQFAVSSRERLTRQVTMQALREAVAAGHRVVVVTASVRDWVEPWFDGLPVEVIATELEVDDRGTLTGRFATPNCNGQEKWRRLEQAVPDVTSSPLTAYGDSSGDRALLHHADVAYYCDFSTPVAQQSWLERHPGVMFWSTLALLVLYQMLGVFFGMDLADAGFYLTFYDNIFTHPESVEYNFMYYLSGVAGGALQSLLPGIGMAGMRLAGVSLCALCAAVLWLSLRGNVGEWPIALGCTLVVTTFIAPPLTLCYDLCTAALYVCAIAALWHAIVRGSAPLAALAGVLAGLNVLVRVPNVLGLSMAAVPLLAAATHFHTWRAGFTQSLAVAGGAAAAVAGVLCLMPPAHYQAFVAVLADLRAIAADTSGTASHSSTQLIATQLSFYGTGLITAVKLGAATLLWLACGLTSRRAVKVVLKAAAVAMLIWFFARMHPLEPMWALCLIGCVAVIATDRGGRLTWIAVMGLGMMFAMPCGSDGAYNNGTIVCWAAAPVASVLWGRRSLRVVPLTLVAVCAVRMVTGGAYFDGGSLLDKRYAIDSPRAAHIFTTRERADALNILLHGIEPHIAPGTTLMAYGSIPTLNYLTGTHPYIGCSWVEQLSAEMLARRLDSAAATELPPVLRQKFNTLGPQWSKPSERFLTDYGRQNTYQDNRKLVVLNDFLRKHGYVTVYEDDYFVLLKPQP